MNHAVVHVHDDDDDDAYAYADDAWFDADHDDDLLILVLRPSALFERVFDEDEMQEDVVRMMWRRMYMSRMLLFGEIIEDDRPRDDVLCVPTPQKQTAQANRPQATQPPSRVPWRRTKASKRSAAWRSRASSTPTGPGAPKKTNGFFEMSLYIGISPTRGWIRNSSQKGFAEILH